MSVQLRDAAEPIAFVTKLATSVMGGAAAKQRRKRTGGIVTGPTGASTSSECEEEKELSEWESEEGDEGREIMRVRGGSEGDDDGDGCGEFGRGR